MANFLLSLLAVPLAAVLVLSAPVEANAQQAPKNSKPPKATKASRKKAKKGRSAVVYTPVAATVAPVGVPAQRTPGQDAVVELRETDDYRGVKPEGSFREVGGGKMLPERTIFENLRRSFNHTELTRALRGSEFEDQKEEVTIFAATDSALSQDPMVEKMTAIGRMHQIRQYIVQGRHLLADVHQKQNWMTVRGYEITVAPDGRNKWVITDFTGKTVRVTVADVPCANGIFNVIDAPLSPDLPPNAPASGGSQGPALRATGRK